MTENEKNEKDVKVEDKRFFDKTGNVRENVVEAKKEESQTIPSQDKIHDEETKAFQIDFSTFIFSVSSATLMSMGFMQNPHTNKIEKDLGVAKQHIDILGMLQEKTKNNLTKDEETLLNNLLYDLRMKFVNVSKK